MEPIRPESIVQFKHVDVAPAAPVGPKAKSGEGKHMHSIIYIVGLIVVVLAVLSLIGLA
jgi:hypothetical protein